MEPSEEELRKYSFETYENAMPVGLESAESSVSRTT